MVLISSPENIPLSKYQFIPIQVTVKRDGKIKNIIYNHHQQYEVSKNAILPAKCD